MAFDKKYGGLIQRKRLLGTLMANLKPTKYGRRLEGVIISL
jgi:hypothetical protein